MCGIAGIVQYNKKTVQSETIHTMLKAIKHRGPDDEGCFLDGHIGLGHVRLSILDLSAAGHQPMTDQTGQYTIIQNGEAYNYVELREELTALGYEFKTQTDTEVVLNGYIEWGENVLDKLNGMFACRISLKQTKMSSSIIWCSTEQTRQRKHSLKIYSNYSTGAV